MSDDPFSSPLSIAQDKQRILNQLKVNFLNMPSSDAECAELVPWMTAQAATITSMLYFEDFRPAELMGLLALLGPVLARSSPLPSTENQRRSLHAV